MSSRQRARRRALETAAIAAWVGVSGVSLVLLVERLFGPDDPVLTGLLIAYGIVSAVVIADLRGPVGHREADPRRTGRPERETYERASSGATSVAPAPLTGVAAGIAVGTRSRGRG